MSRRALILLRLYWSALVVLVSTSAAGAIWWIVVFAHDSIVSRPDLACRDRVVKEVSEELKSPIVSGTSIYDKFNEIFGSKADQANFKVKEALTFRCDVFDAGPGRGYQSTRAWASTTVGLGLWQQSPFALGIALTCGTLAITLLLLSKWVRWVVSPAP